MKARVKFSKREFFNRLLTQELPFLQRRHEAGDLTVFPILCEPCEWQKHPWLATIQNAGRGQALTTLSESERNRVLRSLAATIAGQLGRAALAGMSSPSRFGAERTDVRSETKTYLDKFPLTRGPGLREEKLIGREQELAILDLAYASSFGVPPSGGPGSRVNAELRTPSMLRVNLGNLTDEAGAALLHHRTSAAEINPDDKELLAAAEKLTHDCGYPAATKNSPLPSSPSLVHNRLPK